MGFQVKHFYGFLLFCDAFRLLVQAVEGVDRQMGVLGLNHKTRLQNG